MSDYRSIYEDIEKSKETPMNSFLDDAIKKAQKDFVDNHRVIKIPQPGDKVSFPVACVTGVCFQTSDHSYIWRWNSQHNGLEVWHTTERWWPCKNGKIDNFYGLMNVVDEPKPEPVWKDCNFIEAVEWMKKQLHKPVARWEGSEYYMVTSSGVIRRGFDGALIYDVVGGQEVNYFLGKWQIKVEG